MLSDVCLFDVSLSRTSGVSREQRGLGRLKLAQRLTTSHVTRTPLSMSKGQGHGARHIVAASRAHSLLSELHELGHMVFTKCIT